MSEAADRKTFRLSARLSVEITIGPKSLVCEWDPDLPESMTPAELKAYRMARTEMLAKVIEQ
jgi:hypothetical protein